MKLNGEVRQLPGEVASEQRPEGEEEHTEKIEKIEKIGVVQQGGSDIIIAH